MSHDWVPLFHVWVFYLIGKENVKWCKEQADSQHRPPRRVPQALKKPRIGAAWYTLMRVFRPWKLRERERERFERIRIQTKSVETDGN